MHRAAATLASCLVATACARTLTDQQAHEAHVRNETAVGRALEARGLRELPPADLFEATPVPAAPVVADHPQLGRVIATVARPEIVFAVDRSGVAHEVHVAFHTTEHAKENVHQCAPGTASGGTQLAEPPRPDPALVAHRYYRLGPAEMLGAPLRIVVDRIELEPIYVTGHACRELP